MAQKKIDDHIINKMRRLRASGKTVKQVAALCGVGATSVRLHTAGCVPVKKAAKRRRIRGVVSVLKGPHAGKSGKVVDRAEPIQEDNLAYVKLALDVGDEWVLEAWVT